MILNYWKKICLCSNWKSECLQTSIISTTFFRKFLLKGKKWQRLQNRYFHQLQQIFAVARWNHPYEKNKNIRSRSSKNEVLYLVAVHMKPAVDHSKTLWPIPGLPLTFTANNCQDQLYKGGVKIPLSRLTITFAE